MKIILSTLLMLLVNTLCFAQKDGVNIVEEVTKKRILIYAENTNDIPKQVFLKVDATGFRRRADRPLIETVLPNSKKLLITLIPLTNEESKYTYVFLVSDETENIHAINTKVEKR